jgi:hypothetical protein
MQTEHCFTKWRRYWDLFLLIVYVAYAVGTHSVVTELWKAVDQKPLSAATNLMLAYYWVLYVPIVLQIALIIIGNWLRLSNWIWALFASFILGMFTWVTILWTVGGSASFWKYRL